MQEEDELAQYQFTESKHVHNHKHTTQESYASYSVFPLPLDRHQWPPGQQVVHWARIFQKMVSHYGYMAAQVSAVQMQWDTLDGHGSCLGQ